MSNVIVPPSNAPGTLPVRPNYSLKRYFVITAFLLLFGGLIWMFIAFGSRGFKDVDARRADERYKIYGDVIQADQKTLSDAPSILNKEQGKIRLPLGDAINLTLRDINANKPHAAYPVQATDPAPNPAPPVDQNAPAVSPPTTANSNNPVLPKQADASGSNAANGNPSPSPSPTEGMTNPR